MIKREIAGRKEILRSAEGTRGAKKVNLASSGPLIPEKGGLGYSKTKKEKINKKDEAFRNARVQKRQYLEKKQDNSNLYHPIRIEGQTTISAFLLDERIRKERTLKPSLAAR